MTATPRLYSSDNIKKATDNEAVVWSMDDTKSYGDEIYRIGFGEAVKNGLLSDYKVLVLTLNEDEMSTALQNEITKEGSEIPTDDSLKLIGCINALSKITKDTELLNNVDPGLMHNAIAFCQNIKNSKKTVAMMDKCRDAYYNTLSQEQRERVVSVNADHIDGGMGASERAKKLLWLKNVDRTSNQCNILMNVKCLSEGVDVPSLDAVLFLSAKNSQIDVVQSVGRVMRKAEGKKYGYIIIPVVIPSGMSPEKALDDNKRFAVVWSVLQALRAHDDRFNATVNKIELNKKKPSQILVGGVSSLDSDEPKDGTTSTIEDAVGKQLYLNFGELQNAVYSQLVKKVGDRRYWEQWASDIAQIAERHIVQINSLISEEGSNAQKAFNRYLKGLRKNINPSVTKQDAVEMLAQHFITQPVFDALFENYSFASNNPISTAMSGMVKLLQEQTPKEDNEKLERFYDSVRERCKNIDNAEGKQKIIIELYDKFFKTAFPKTVEKLGIVYTPVEVVDFIINSVEDIMEKEFGRSISDENVHVLDPFTGTGTFMVRLLQSGIIKPEDLGRKYKNELHACEIVLLAYYIASINIENTYHDLVKQHVEASLSEEDDELSKYEDNYLQMAAEEEPSLKPEIKYEPFEGICLTDTFQMGEDNNELLEEVFPQNSKRVNKLKKTPITVIIGNPPYSVGANDGTGVNKNESYPFLEEKIGSTYMAKSNSRGLRSLFDSYIKAFRWSTDRIGNNNGIIGFVTNAGWLDGNAMDGMRKCLEEEFSSIYILNLRGNCRTSGELRRKEGDNIFGLGSRTPIAITILVKKKDYQGKAKIFYNAVEDYMTREEKLELCKTYNSMLNKIMKKEIVHPDENGGWIRKKSNKFDSFIPLASRTDEKSFFLLNSGGLFTSRDAWCYNFSEVVVKKNVEKLIKNYNDELDLYLKQNHTEDPKSIVNLDPKVGSWTRAMYASFKSKKRKEFIEEECTTSTYRPFVKEKVYFSNSVNECCYQLRKLFPSSSSKNTAICFPGLGSTKDFSALLVSDIPCLDLIDKTQCLPMFVYKENKILQEDLFFKEEHSFKKEDGISDFIWNHAISKYGPNVTKEDIFYYVYGILHSKSFLQKFSDDLKLTLPRLPLLSESNMFWKFSQAGRDLAELHLNYETVPPYEGVSVDDAHVDYEVTKMHFPKKGQTDTIIYNEYVTIKNIPARAYEYVINGKSAIEWIMERYQVTIDKKSEIKNDPNDWGREHGNPRYILDLLLSIINVSMQTMDIIDGLPEVDWDNE